MSMVGTFDGFTAARLGIYAAQHGLRVTGNNVANINTLGYTRQRADQISFKVGVNDMYRSFYDNHIGSGTLVRSISQIRDPFLDIRYRNASTDTYHYDTWLAGLQDIASILDEVGKGDNDDGLIYKAIQDLAEKLRAYSADPTGLNDRLVRDSAESLNALFHNAATRLETLYNETERELNESVSAVNEILTKIRDLNKSIREAEIHGDTALEMRDERNRQIDALSQYLDINVEYSLEDVGAGTQVEKLTIKLNNANPDIGVHTDESVLVDGEYAVQLSVPEEKPRLNGYDGTNPPESAYLKGYKYLKAVAMTQDELDKFSADNGYAPIWEKQDENGNYLCLFGTNDPDVDGIVTEKNDNFTIQLGKLLNAKGAEWKKTTTTWAELTGSGAPAKASKSYTIGINLTDASSLEDEFSIGGTPYHISDIVDDIADLTAENFAEFVARKLSDQYEDYSVSAKDGKIIFTAKEPGEVDPTAVPALALNPNNTWVTLTDNNDFKNGSLPDDAGTVETDEHGNVVKSVDYVQAGGTWYRLTISTEYTHEVTLDDNDLRGILQAQRELLTEEGEFASEKDVAIDESALTKRGIPYYMKSLDLLAQKFAEAYNQLNTGYAYNQDGNYIDKDGNVLMLEDADEPIYDEDGVTVIGYVSKPVSVEDGPTKGQLQNLTNNNYTLESWLEQKGYSMGGKLFTQLDGETAEGITAKTISISYGWSNGDWGLVPTFKMLFADGEGGGLTHSTQNDNADHMVAMIGNSLTYNPRDLFGSDAIGPNLFTGSFNDMLGNMMAVQGEDASITGVRLNTAAGILNEVDYSREGVSGVDLNDEAMNMITYQKAMTAAMRVMTTIDELLDRLINNTGIAGR